MAILDPTELCALAAGALWLSFTTSAHAERLSPALVVTRAPGAEGCPDATGVAARVRAMTHEDPFVPRPEAPRDTWLEVEFVQTLSGYRAVITARGRRQGSRSIDDVGPDCTSLSDAVAITLVMLLDPSVQASQIPAAPSEAAVARRDDAADPAPPVSFGAEASGGAVLGVLEHGGPFVEAGGRVGMGRVFALALGGGFVFPDRASAPPGSVTLDLWYGYARFSSVVLGEDSARLSLFLGPSIGSLGGSSEGFDYAPDRRLLWVAGEFGVEAFAKLSGSFSWSARLAAVTPFRYEGFYVTEAGVPYSAFRTSGIAGALSLGVSAEL